MANGLVMHEKYKYTRLRSMVPPVVGFDIRAFSEQQAVIRNIEYQIRNGERQLPTKRKCTDCGKQAKHYYYNSYDLSDENIITPLCTPCKILRETMGVSIEHFDEYILDYLKTRPEGVEIYSIMIKCAMFEFDDEDSNWNPEELRPAVQSYIHRLVKDGSVKVVKISSRKKIYKPVSTV